MKKLYLLNAMIIPISGNCKEFEIRGIELSAEGLRDFVAKEMETKQIVSAISAIGHESTANLLEKLLGIPVNCARIKVYLRKGDGALCMLLNERLPEGKVLDDKEIERLLKSGKIKFYYIWRTE